MSRLVVGALSSELMGHVAVALRRHRQWAAGQGVRLPAGFADLERLVTSGASEGQPGTPLEDLWEFSQARVMTPSVLTYEQVAASLSCSPRQVKRLVADGSLVAVRVGGAARVRVSDLDAYVSGLPVREAS